MRRQDEAEWETALKAYPELRGASTTPMAEGGGRVYRVEGQTGRFVLRIDPVEAMSDATAEAQAIWMAGLNESADVRAPMPVQDAQGRWWGMLEADGRMWRRTLCRWVDGDRCESAQAFVEADVLREVGRTVGRMHIYSLKFGQVDGIRTTTAQSLVGAGSCLGDGTAESIIEKADLTVFRQAARRVASALEEADAKDFGLIHGDLGPANWVFDRGEARPIDFGEFGYGHFGFDLMGVLWTHAGWAEYRHYRDVLLEGYGEVHPVGQTMTEQLDLWQGARFFAWLNHGCRLADPAARAEFLRWVPMTAKLVEQFCGKNV